MVTAVNREIISMIEGAKSVPAAVEEASHLYTDLGFDSLTFIELLTKIEEAYSISFGLMEMETCLQLDRLIKLVQDKIKERDNHDQALAHRSEELG